MPTLAIAGRADAERVDIKLRRGSLEGKEK
jgi:hypothetical protein